MKRYRNLDGQSGVVAYAITGDAIAVKFQGGDTYDYTHVKPGRRHVDNMKLLAEAGQGLATYISRYVRDDYAGKR